jgi:hypothetical protein
MTSEQKIELEYLIDLLREASKWNTDQGDDALRLEVDLRINNILNSVEVEGKTEVQGEPEVSPVLTEDDYKALEAIKVNEHLASPDKAAKVVSDWKSKRVRCQENGHPVWHLRSECVKEPRDNRNGGPAWTWKWIGPQDKKKQEDAMWAEHEAGNAE